MNHPPENLFSSEKNDPIIIGPQKNTTQIKRRIIFSHPDFTVGF